MSSNEIDVFVETVNDSTLKMKKLNLDKNLSYNRKKLDMNLLLFAKKLDDKYAEIDRKEEEEIRLNEIIFDNSGNKFLYLLKNSSPCWNYLNDKCRLDHGRIMSFDGNKISSYRAFKLKNCEFKLTGSEKYKKGRLEFKSEEDWIKKKNLFFNVDINVQDFVGLALSIEKSKDENFNDEIDSIYKYTKIGKASLKFSKENLELTDDFKNDVNEAINSKEPRHFLDIIRKYGQFVPTEIILGGRVYFRDVKSSFKSSVNKSEGGSVNAKIKSFTTNIGINFSKSKNKSKFYGSDHMRIIGGNHPDEENFDEKVWIESLKDYQTWDCIEFNNLISIFKLLPDNLYKEIFKSIGKRILYTSIIEEYDYYLYEPGRCLTIGLRNIPKNISNIILNEEADCDIFAAVVDTAKNSQRVFFNCQILKKEKAKPTIIIHGIQKEFQECKCKLNIGIMIIGYDTDFNLIHSDVSVELIKNIYNSNNPNMTLPSEDELITANTPFFGIPVLSNFGNLNSSTAIGHNFRKLDNNPNELKIDTFFYCLKQNCYVNLTEFTFCTIIIKACPKAYKLFKLDLSQNEIDISKEFNDSNPKYISLYLSDANSYIPVFMNQKGKKVYIEHICKNCDKCISQSSKSKKSHNIEFIFFNPDMNNN
ncbi:unnamed protein product [Rhizophagus irregularis]|uniref:Uncharacterized protein n=1 Tax=Rhizophagus irregularis TaxID=588596 RepID=A0A2I1GDD2_9GLOM|nr:hypothetical protein RhiirA4_514303 [Rhizophagus irregularis]CAB4436187.1 unnamed protein product [Rhizophagus irregularis]